MASMQEYCEKLSTPQLQALVREECAGRGALSPEAILMICGILAQRCADRPDVKTVLLELCRVYLD